MGINSLLAPITKPPSNELRTVRGRGTDTTYQVLVLTNKLEGVPYYRYQVYLDGVLVLELISNPGNDDIADAIVRHRSANHERRTK